jgi:uncharacterized protein (DUF1800 family)
MSAVHAPTLDAARRRLFGLLPAVTGAGAVPMRRPGKDGADPVPVPVAADAPAQSEAVTTPPALVRWLNRASFGATPESIAELAALGGNDDARWQAWVDQQLNPAAIADPAVDARLTAASHPTLFKTLGQLWTDHHAETANYAVRMRPIAEAECAKLVRAVYSRRQGFEVLVDFWHDHFSTFGWHYDGGPVFPHYDREVIRVHALGNFRAMLGAVARATTMMYYLDLRSNRRDGPNENFARELVELHTLGAENYAGVLRPDDPGLPMGVGNDGANVRLKYVDEDVYNATRALTGWTIRDGHWQFPAENDGSYVFRAGWHDNYSKWFLNRFIQSYKGEADGEIVLNTLAAHPGTARHVCRKLCRRLIADSPPDSIVESAAAVFGSLWQSPDQLRQVVRHILLSNEFKTAFNQKVARPFQATAAALRALYADFTPVWDNTAPWTTSEEFTSRLQSTGQRPFYWAAPNGYPDRQEAWSSSGALAMTWKLLTRLVELRQDRNNPASALLADVATQTMTALPAGDRTANTIVDYWFARLYGYQPEPARRAVLVDFMRQNAAATDVLDLATDSWSGNNLRQHYTRQRLRTLVAMIMCAPEFFRR